MLTISVMGKIPFVPFPHCAAKRLFQYNILQKVTQSSPRNYKHNIRHLRRKDGQLHRSGIVSISALLIQIKVTNSNQERLLALNKAVKLCDVSVNKSVKSCDILKT